MPRDNKSDSKFWWTLDREDLHQAVFEVVDTIEQNSGWKFENILTYRKYYLNRDLKSLNPDGAIGLETLSSFRSEMTYNAIKMGIDTLSAKIAKQKPRIKFLTSDGSWEQQERAKNLTRFVDAVFDENKVYIQAHKVFLNTCVDGMGFFKVYGDPDSRKICIDVVPAHRIKVDEVEAHDGKPEQMHQEDFISRHKLKMMFPKYRDEIDSCDSSDQVDITVADRIKVIESWHLPSVPGGDDGLHTICIQNATLVCEPWTKDKFPFAYMRWSEPMQGFYGESAVYEVSDIQDRLNEVMDTIIIGTRLMCVPRIWIQDGTTINEEDITNVPGELVRFSGPVPPQSSVATGASPEMYQLANEYFNRIFECLGVSSLSVTARKPDGLDSGKAMMTYADIESERFSLAHLHYQDLFVQLADQVIDCAQEMFTSRTKVKLREKNKFISQAFWGDIDMDRDKFQMSAFATNFLPRDPAGQLQFATELVKAKIVTGEDALALLDFEDTQSAVQKATAEREIAEKLIANILFKGRYVEPEKWMNPANLLEVGRRRYLQAVVDDDIDAENLDLALTYLDKLEALLAPPEPEPAPAPLPGLPEGVPLPPEGMPPLPPEGGDGGAPPMPPI